MNTPPEGPETAQPTKSDPTQWNTPEFEEIPLGCEVGAYAPPGYDLPERK